MTYENLFYFSQAPTILSHIIPRPSPLLGLHPNQDIYIYIYVINRKLEMSRSKGSPSFI